MSQASPVIVPPYSTAQPNVPLSLYEGPIALEQDGQQVNCDAQICFEWLPSLRISFSSTQSDSDKVPPLDTIGITDEDKPVTVSVPGAVAPVPLGISNEACSQGSEGISISLSGYCEESIIFNTGADLHRVHFHLVNFERMMEQSIEDGSNSWMGRTTAEFDGWKLTLDTLGNYRELKKALKTQGGYAITHAVQLERVDGSSFSVAQAKRVLDALFWFFSLARGFWSPPILPVGFDVQGERIWQEWRALRATAWRDTSGWLSGTRYVSDSLQGALRGFWKKWNDPTWNDPANNNMPLIGAIHWFISSNTDAGGVEGCIILAQTGLELVAWVRLVEDKKIYTDVQFDGGKDTSGKRCKGFNAAEKFEELLKHIGVNAVIPAAHAKLTELANTKGWANGPAAIAGYRNTIVHPKRRAQNEDVVFRESYEMRELALWYLELSLLHLFGYKGHYVNRVQDPPWLVGQTELVPWAPPPSTP